MTEPIAAQPMGALLCHLRGLKQRPPKPVESHGRELAQGELQNRFSWIYQVEIVSALCNMPKAERQSSVPFAW